MRTLGRLLHHAACRWATNQFDCIALRSVPVTSASWIHVADLYSLRDAVRISYRPGTARRGFATPRFSVRDANIKDALRSWPIQSHKVPPQDSKKT